MRTTDSENGAKDLEQSEHQAAIMLAAQKCFVWDSRGNGSGGVSPTLTGDHENRITDYTAVAVYDTTQITSPQNYSNPKPGDACHPLASQQHPPLAVCAGNGQLNQISMANQSNTLDCMHDQQIVLTDSKPPRKYIVRRLLPLECCRLQGYPDGWTENISFDALSQEQVDQLEPIRKTWAEVNGKNYKPCKNMDALRKWFEGLRTDSAEYKAYGNSLAIPCSHDVIRRVAKEIRRTNNETGGDT